MSVTEIDEEEQEEIEIGDPPYIYSPYPNTIVKVSEPDSPGGRDVMELIDEHWPLKINELEEMTEEQEMGESGDGYTGSFIRQILRNHYAPEDLLKQAEEQEDNTPAGEFSDPEVPSDTEDEETWHRIFRMGIRAALEGGLAEHEVQDAFMAGYIEGEKLKEEME